MLYYNCKIVRFCKFNTNNFNWEESSIFNSSAILWYFDTHQDLPHVSKYHRENYREHCLLTIDEMFKRTEESTLLIAACLHDIAKPRIQGLNKIGEPCFYGHEEITDEEMSQFLTLDDERFLYVKALVLCHMTPYKVVTASDYDSTLVKSCKKTLRKAEIDIEVNDEFIHDLTLLHQADDAGSVRRDEDLVGIEERCEHACQMVCGLQ